jgi:hypothetical protein
LRPITHVASQAMAYDERYTPLLKRVKLATVAQLCQRGLPPLNPTALTTMIDRWRPETHSFHLTCGELSITLQDQAMIFGLSIRGFAVTGNVVSDGWEARVTAFLGRPLPDLEPGKKRRTSGVPLRWLRAQFAPRLLPTYHCHAWVLHMFGTVLFPNGTGDTASWMYIHCLLYWDDAGNRSWGSVVLAYLYRQLCEACLRTGGAHAMISGCMTLLQVCSVIIL